MKQFFNWSDIRLGLLVAIIVVGGWWIAVKAAEIGAF
jgi:hypothetical protein